MEDEFPNSARPVRMEGHAFWPAGLVVGAHAGHECSHDHGPPPHLRGGSGCRVRAGDPAALADGVPGATGSLHRSVVVYMDDMICYSPSLKQHMKDVSVAPSILRQEGLYVKASKCEFGRCELGFLGHRVSAAGFAVKQRKVSAVRGWPVQ